jgi:hypothetical protein
MRPPIPRPSCIGHASAPAVSAEPGFIAQAPIPPSPCPPCIAPAPLPPWATAAPLASSANANTVVIDFIIIPLSCRAHARLLWYDPFRARTLPQAATMLICIKPGAGSAALPGDARRAG